MFAIFKTGGKQYSVKENDVLYIEKMDVEPGQEIIFNEVLSIGAKIGSPLLKNAFVKATVEKHGKGEKIIVRKFKKKKGYNVKQGHRQAYTKITIGSFGIKKEEKDSE